MIEIVYTDDDGSQRKGPKLDGAGSWFKPDVCTLYLWGQRDEAWLYQDNYVSNDGICCLQ